MRRRAGVAAGARRRRVAGGVVWEGRPGVEGGVGCASRNPPYGFCRCLVFGGDGGFQGGDFVGELNLAGEAGGFLAVVGAVEQVVFVGA